MTQTIVPKELLTATPGGLSLLVVSGGADGQVLTQQADGTYAPATVSAGIGGSVGSKDNRLVRSDGTGGSTVQSTGITVDDSNNVSGVGTLSVGNGSVSAPSLTMGDAGTGFYRPTSGEICIATGGQNWISFFQAIAINLKSNLKYGISSDSTNARTAPDVTLARNSTGPAWIIAADGGAQIRNLANSADAALTAAAITSSALMCCGVYTFATVPSASSNTGKFLRISDRAQKHAYSDGTNWRFFGDDAVIS